MWILRHWKGWPFPPPYISSHRAHRNNLGTLHSWSDPFALYLPGNCWICFLGGELYSKDDKWCIFCHCSKLLPYQVRENHRLFPPFLFLASALDFFICSYVRSIFSDVTWINNGGNTLFVYLCISGILSGFWAFARKSSNVQNFLKLSKQLDFGNLTPEMQKNKKNKKNGGHQAHFEDKLCGRPC